MGLQLPLKGAQTPSFQFVYCGQMAGWMKMPLGTEVDLGRPHCIRRGVPALRERGTAASLFSAHVYCGHGRPSQLLLSSCNNNHECRWVTDAPGIILSGPAVALGIVKSRSILAALSVSDLKLWGIGVFTMMQHHLCAVSLSVNSVITKIAPKQWN